MIIKTYSDQETKAVNEIYEDLCSKLGEKVVFIPHRLNAMWYTFDSSEKELIVVLSDDAEDLAIIKGFYDVQSCKDFAKKVAAEAGLSEDCIDGDVWEVENSTIDKETKELIVKSLASDFFDQMNNILFDLEADEKLKGMLAGMISNLEKTVEKNVLNKHAEACRV
jgi:hypothetical protein